MSPHRFQLGKAREAEGVPHSDLSDCLKQRLPGVELGIDAHRPRRGKDHEGFSSRDPHGNEFSYVLNATFTPPAGLEVSRDDARRYIEECLKTIGRSDIEVRPD